MKGVPLCLPLLQPGTPKSFALNVQGRVSQLALGRRPRTTLGNRVAGCYKFISYKVFFKSFCRSRPPHKRVNLSFTITNIMNQLMELCEN